MRSTKRLSVATALAVLFASFAHSAAAQTRSSKDSPDDGSARIKGRAVAAAAAPIFGGPAGAGLAALLQVWDLKAVRVRSKSPAGSVDDKVLKDVADLIGKINAAKKAAKKAGAGGAKKAARAVGKAAGAGSSPKVADDGAKADDPADAAEPADLPTQEELDKLTVALPFTFPSAGENTDHQHVIFWDNTGKGGRASWHEPQWERQAEVLRDKLAELGVARSQIHIYPVKKQEDFFSGLKAHPGQKKVYVFGHGSPLVMHFGFEDVSVTEHAEALQDQKVDMICHYGCSFVNVNEEDLEPLQEKLREGTRITLYGHREPSTKTDDTPFDEDNPIMRCEVDGECSRMYESRREVAGRAAGMARDLLRGLPGPMSGLDSHALRQAAAYDGMAPQRVPPPPSIFDLLRPRLANLRKKLAASPADPKKAPPVTGDDPPPAKKGLKIAAPPPPKTPAKPVSAKKADPAKPDSWLTRMGRLFGDAADSWYRRLTGK